MSCLGVDSSRLWVGSLWSFCSKTMTGYQTKSEKKLLWSNIVNPKWDLRACIEWFTIGAGVALSL